MRKFLAIPSLFICICTSLAQEAEQVSDNNNLNNYRRSSLYSVLVKHSSAPFGKEIDSAFMSIPIPDKFNDHNLPICSFESSAPTMQQSGKNKNMYNLNDVVAFKDSTRAAASLVAKWFNRDPNTGAFDVELVRERGFYNASQDDIEAALLTERKLSVLGDAGEELIGNTFMIVNDITFVDKGANSAVAASAISIVGGLAAAFLNSKELNDATYLVASATNEIDGFTVNISTYLYQLGWGEDVAGEFYTTMWMDSTSLDPARKAVFDTTSLFKLHYVGMTTTSASNLSSKSMSTVSKSDQMLKVCTRAIDKAIVQLQREYEQFRVKVPVGPVSEDKKTVQVAIGLKDGVSTKNKYEVLMPVQNSKGEISYKRVATIQPLKGMIWDNRFGALEEAQLLAANNEKVQDKEGSEGDVTLTSSTFKILSGGAQIVPGCLVREMSINK